MTFDSLELITVPAIRATKTFPFLRPGITVSVDRNENPALLFHDVDIPTCQERVGKVKEMLKEKHVFSAGVSGAGKVCSRLSCDPVSFVIDFSLPPHILCRLASTLTSRGLADISTLT